MLDAIGALGIAANIVQFVDFTGRLLSKSKQIHRSIEGALVANLELEAIASHVKKLSREIEAGLYVQEKKYPIQHVQVEVGEEVDQENLDDLELRRLCRQSIIEAQGLLEALEKLKIKDNRLRSWDSFRAALRAMWKEDEIEALAQRLNSTRQMIDSRILVAIRSNIKVTDQKQLDLLHNLASVGQVAQDLNHNVKGYIHEDKKWKAEIIDLLRLNANGQANPEEVVVKFAKVTEEMRAEQITENILEQLRFYEMTHREEMVARAHRKTFGWIFDPQERQKQKWTNFAGWLSGKDNLYWITGKAGSGKSTLMKFLLSSGWTKEYLRQCAGSFPLIVTEFFFWNSGTAMQMSAQGLLRILIYQAATQCRNLIPSLFPKRWHNHKCYGDHLHPWDLLELQNAFKALLQEDQKSVKLCFFIDGLDEFSGDRAELVKMVQGFVSGSTAKFCISSRPWICFEDAFHHGPHLRLERLTYPDIVAYINSQFRENAQFLELEEEEPEYTKQLVNETASKAAGVFLWVVLVVRSLLDGFSNADRTSDLQRRLDALPADLEDLFSKLLDRIDPFYREHASQLFQIFRATHAPLTLLQLSFADEDPDFAIRADVKPLTQKEIIRRQEVMNRRLKSRCMGLLEVSSMSNTNEVDAESLRSPHMTGLEPLAYKVNRSHPIRYLHRTVKDYFEQPLVWERIISMNRRHYHPNLALLRSYLLCLKSFSKMNANLLTDYTILAMIHARRAESETGEASIALLDELNNTLNTICGVESSLAEIQHDSTRKSWTLVSGCIPLALQPGSTFLSFAVMADLCLYVQQKIDGVSSRLSDDEGCPLLIYALTKSLQPMLQPSWPPIEMIKILLEQGADPNEHFNRKYILSYVLDAAAGSQPKEYVPPRSLFSYNLGAIFEPRSETFLDSEEMEKWADVIELFIHFGVEPSTEETHDINKFLSNLDPVRAKQIERLLQEKESSNHWNQDHETSSKNDGFSKPVSASTIHEFEVQRKPKPQHRSTLWRRIGGKLFGR